MQKKRIIEGQWYQTKKGIGRYTGWSGSQLEFEIDGKKVWLSSSEVQHGIAQGEEPQEKKEPLDAPAVNSQPAHTQRFDMSKVVEMQLLDYAVDLHWEAKKALRGWDGALVVGDKRDLVTIQEITKKIDDLLNAARRLVTGETS